MARKATGTVVEHQARDGRTYRALRFTAYGKRRYLSLGAATHEEAERELRHVLADVERGTWKPAVGVEPPPEPEAVPTFHEFAEQWWVRTRGRLAPKTKTDYLWRLECHLIPYFGELRLDGITFDTVEGYIASKLAEAEGIRAARAEAEARGERYEGRRPLGASTINKTVILLAAVLEAAVERDLIARNAAKGKGRRVRERTPPRSYLDTADQIAALIDAAGSLDRDGRTEYRHVERRAIVTTLVFAGLRIGELAALRWHDVDLASGWLHVGDAKTDAGRRRVKVRGALRDELASVKARSGYTAPADPVFATRTGRRSSVDNIRSRVVNPAVEAASARLVADDSPPLPARVTPHSLRRTFASVLYALGENPAVVMAEMGHTDPGLALRIYAQAMRRDDADQDRLRALVEGSQLAVIGRRAVSEPQAHSVQQAPE
ncbi:MAG: site-specific integrase [Actinomycetota bacterium]|nr:site-specific integrase [Actinomycetota bacterium]